MSKKLGEMIAKRRKREGKTADEMARLLSVQTGTYLMMEEGIAVIPVNNAALISKELKLKPFEMFRASLKG